MEERKYFLSYGRKDSEFVLKLAKELRAVGANLWPDQLDILGGQRWDRAVEGALETCQGMIVVLSPESLASNNVMDEVSYALEEGKLVIPILLRSCAIPFRLRRVQHIDFTVGYDLRFSRLLRTLRIDHPSQPREPAAPEKAIIKDVTAPLEEMPKEVPSLGQLPGKTEPPEPAKQVAQEVAEPLADTPTEGKRELPEAQITRHSATQSSPTAINRTTVSNTLRSKESADASLSSIKQYLGLYLACFILQQIGWFAVGCLVVAVRFFIYAYEDAGSDTAIATIIAVFVGIASFYYGFVHFDSRIRRYSEKGSAIIKVLTFLIGLIATIFVWSIQELRR